MAEESIGTDWEGWDIDAESKAEIDRILAEKILDPASPSFMAPPVKRPAGVDPVIAVAVPEFAK